MEFSALKITCCKYTSSTVKKEIRERKNSSKQPCIIMHYANWAEVGASKRAGVLKQYLSWPSLTFQHKMLLLQLLTVMVLMVNVMMTVATTAWLHDEAATAGTLFTANQICVVSATFDTANKIYLSISFFFVINLSNKFPILPSNNVNCHLF